MVHRLSGKKAVGIKQSIKYMKAGKGKTLYVANDADLELQRTVVNVAEENQIEINYVTTMKELGKLCGIDVGAAAALILNE